MQIFGFFRYSILSHLERLKVVAFSTSRVQKDWIEAVVVPKKFTLFFLTLIGLCFIIIYIHAYHWFHGYGIKVSLFWLSSSLRRERGDNQCKEIEISSSSWLLKLQGFPYALKNLKWPITSLVDCELQENGSWLHSPIFGFLSYECWLSQCVVYPWIIFGSSSSYHYTKHLFSQVSPFSLGESRFWRCALISYLFRLKLGFLIRSVCFLFFEQDLILWYSMYAEVSMFKILAINSIQKKFNCSDDQWFDSIGGKVNSWFFGQNCVP